MVKSFGELKRWVMDLPAWRADNPILTIESDDWGSIRTNSKQAGKYLEKMKQLVDVNPYQLYDGLETESDIELLLEVLKAVRVKNGEGAVMTLNYCTANPDFDKIEAEGYKSYCREPFTQTYKSYGKSEGVVDLVKEGFARALFDVQFHGTEHLNVNRWMRALQQGDRQTMEAFSGRVFSPAIAKSTGYAMEYMDALDYDDASESKEHIQQLEEGLKIFRDVWGNSPKSFIAPCYRWSEPIEEFLAANGICFIQGQRAQLHPTNGMGFAQRKIFRYTGQRNRLGQIYTVRNVTFEPSIHGTSTSLAMAKQQIQQAFELKIPAIVSSHRINYTSRLDASNRNNSVKSLQVLLEWVAAKFPSVEFLGSAALGERIMKTMN
jgi:hypothetical protein